MEDSMGIVDGSDVGDVGKLDVLAEGTDCCAFEEGVGP